ncbi:hypothetical protein JTB14_035006, partial [Gonioctena quinquepunctata]
ISSLYFPPIEPLKISSLTIGAGSTAVNLVQHYQDIRAHGFVTKYVKNTHFDVVEKKLSFTTFHEELRQEARYNINGKVMFLTVFGDGDSIIKLRNATIGHIITFDEKIKGNKKYFLISDYKATINIEGAHLDFANLFNGDEKLGQTILLVINDNWKLVFEDIKDQLESAYAQVLRSVASRFFENIPIDEILLK